VSVEEGATLYFVVQLFTTPVLSLDLIMLSFFISYSIVVSPSLLSLTHEPTQRSKTHLLVIRFFHFHPNNLFWALGMLLNKVSPIQIFVEPKLTHEATTSAPCLYISTFSVFVFYYKFSFALSAFALGSFGVAQRFNWKVLHNLVLLPSLL